MAGGKPPRTAPSSSSRSCPNARSAAALMYVKLAEVAVQGVVPVGNPIKYLLALLVQSLRRHGSSPQASPARFASAWRTAWSSSA